MIELLTSRLIYVPVRHSCGHFEARLTRWGSNPDDKARGYLSAGSVCSTCSAQGRPVSEQFLTLDAVTTHCTAATR